VHDCVEIEKLFVIRENKRKGSSILENREIWNVIGYQSLNITRSYLDYQGQLYNNKTLVSKVSPTSWIQRPP